jgi:hypothetical protein
MFGWKEWDKNILYLQKSSIKILDIGIGNGETMEKFSQVFLEHNKESVYYGIKTNKKDFKSETLLDTSSDDNIKLNDRKNKSLAQDRIFITEETSNLESNVILSNFLKESLTFDVIYVNSSYYSKDILLDSLIAFKLLKNNGIMIFNNYLWEKTDDKVYTPKPSIDIILNIYKHEIDVLYLGYQVMIKKKEIKEVKKKDIVIVDEFISLIDNYWLINDIKEFGIIVKSSTIPDIKPIFGDFNNLNIRALDDIEIFNKLNIINVMYKYCSIEYIQNEINNKQEYSKLRKLDIISKESYYSIYNTINVLKSYSKPYKTEYKVLLNIEKDSKVLRETTSRNSFLLKDEVKLYEINLLNHYTNKESIDDVIKKYREKNTKADYFAGHHILKYMDLKKMYNNVLLQVLLLNDTLKIDGTFQIIIEVRNDFINDLLTLLNYVFEKIRLFISSNKIGRLSIKINASGFKGIEEDLYKKILDIVKEGSKSNKEIISIFSEQKGFIDCAGLENNIFSKTKKIINHLKLNKDDIIRNIKRVNDSINKRTLNDISTFVLNRLK